MPMRQELETIPQDLLGEVSNDREAWIFLTSNQTGGISLEYKRIQL